MKVSVESSAFKAGQPIPRKYTADGQNVSPPLAWGDLPKETKEIALICDDPDAPSPQPWVHWVIYNIPPDAQGLNEGSPPAGALEGKNSWKTNGYRGPEPPKGHGVHHYHFKVYALSAPLNVQAGLDKAALLKAIEGKILTEGELVGTYERK